MKIKLTWFLLLLCSSQVFAQQKMGLNALFESLKENDPELKSLGLTKESLLLQSRAVKGFEPLEVEFDAPNLGRDEVSVMASQEFELGGLKASRSASLVKESELLDVIILKRENELFQKLIIPFIELTILEKESEDLESLFAIVEETYAKVKALNGIGHSPELDLKRLTLELKELEFSKKRIVQSIESKKKQVGVLCKVTDIDFVNSPLNLEALLNHNLDQVSFFELQDVDRSKQRELDKAKLKEFDIPLLSNLSVGIGMTRNNLDSELNPDLKLGLSFPLFTKNTATYESQERLVRAQSKSLDSKRIEEELELESISLEILNLKSKLDFLKNEMIPGYQEVLMKIATLENVEGFSFVDFQMAKRELVQLNKSYYGLLKELGDSYVSLIEFSGEIKNVFK